MKRIVASAIFVPLLFILQGFTCAQTSQDQFDPNYKIVQGLLERRISAIDYSLRDGTTTIDFVATPLMPKATGKAKIKVSKGYTQIEAEFEHLEPATRFGPEYLTYVLWAITPEDKPAKLGEILLSAGKGNLTVINSWDAFGLIVTAEPYSEVSQPNDVVVLEHFIHPERRIPFNQIEIRYELVARGQYAQNALPKDLKSNQLADDIPLGLREARNAVRIARSSGADLYATDLYANAQELLHQAELSRMQQQLKLMMMLARQAAQAAEDSRLLSLKRLEEIRLSAEINAAARKLAKEWEAVEQTKAEEGRSNLLRAQQELIAAAAEARRKASEGKMVIPTVPDKKNSEVPGTTVTIPKEHQSLVLRRQLIAQFNSFLQARDTNKGLIVNMPDVSFDVGQSTLKPEAREKLARVSGIIVAHPELRLEIEGHTDSTGPPEYNQLLSEKRAEAVRDFLMQQGIDGSMVSACGFGGTNPITSNETAIGRRSNRRVVMIVSGEIIGTPSYSTFGIVGSATK